MCDDLFGVCICSNGARACHRRRFYQWQSHQRRSHPRRAHLQRPICSGLTCDSPICFGRRNTCTCHRWHHLCSCLWRHCESGWRCLRRSRSLRRPRQHATRFNELQKLALDPQPTHIGSSRHTKLPHCIVKAVEGLATVERDRARDDVGLRRLPSPRDDRRLAAVSFIRSITLSASCCSAAVGRPGFELAVCALELAASGGRWRHCRRWSGCAAWSMTAASD